MGAGGPRGWMGGTRIGDGLTMARGSDRSTRLGAWGSLGGADGLGGAGWVARRCPTHTPTQSAGSRHRETGRAPDPDTESTEERRAQIQKQSGPDRERRSPIERAPGRGLTQRARARAPTQRAPTQRAPRPDTKSAAPRHKERRPRAEPRHRAPGPDRQIVGPRRTDRKRNRVLGEDRHPRRRLSTESTGPRHNFGGPRGKERWAPTAPGPDTESRAPTQRAPGPDDRKSDGLP